MPKKYADLSVEELNKAVLEAAREARLLDEDHMPELAWPGLKPTSCARAAGIITRAWSSACSAARLTCSTTATGTPSGLYVRLGAARCSHARRLPRSTWRRCGAS